MIGDREQVYENIKLALQSRQYNSKVEINDPVLCFEDKEIILRNYLESRQTRKFIINRKVAEMILHVGTGLVGLVTGITGKDNLDGMTGPAIVTCNHFSPLDPAIVSFCMRKNGFKNIDFVNQDSNLAMKGMVGYMQRYADTMPVSSMRWFMETEFPAQIKKALDNNRLVLIYPEQEMWFNYRKPRPCKRGAYLYAVKFNVPVISLFVEQSVRSTHLHRFKVHILPVIYPDRQLDERTASLKMQHTDYEQKCAAYVKAYGKKLTYDFEDGDIAGR